MDPLEKDIAGKLTVLIEHDLANGYTLYDPPELFTRARCPSTQYATEEILPISINGIPLVPFSGHKWNAGVQCQGWVIFQYKAIDSHPCDSDSGTPPPE